MTTPVPFDSLLCNAPNCLFGDECPRKWFKYNLSLTEYTQRSRKFSKKSALFPMVADSIHPAVDDMEVYPSECIQAEAVVRFYINTKKVPFKQLVETVSNKCFRDAIVHSSGYVPKSKMKKLQILGIRNITVSGWREVIGLLARSIPTRCVFNYSEGAIQWMLAVDDVKYTIDNSAVTAIYFNNCRIEDITGASVHIPDFCYNIPSQSWVIDETYDPYMSALVNYDDYLAKVPPVKGSYIKACKA